MPNTKRRVEEEPEEIFHVEVITKARVVAPSSDEEDEDEQEKRSKKRKKRKTKKPKQFKWEYYVKWANYDSDSNSWEPEENVAGCQRLLASFWDHVGTDNNDYDAGYEVAADDKWINKEKRYFQTEYNEEQEKLRKKREREERHRHKKPKKKTSTVETSRHSASAKSRTNSLTTSNLAHEEESDDDIPLLKKQKLDRAPETSDDDIPLIKIPARQMGINVSVDAAKSTEGQQNLPKPKDPVTSLFSSPEPELPETQPPPTSLLLPPPSTLPTKKLITTIPPKVLHPSTHLKPAAMAPDNVASGSGLSTKHRLSLGASALRPPKAIPLPMPQVRNQLPLPRTGSTTLISTSFKKKTVSTPVIPLAGSAEDTQSPTLPFGQEPPSTINSNVTPSPTTQYDDASRQPIPPPIPPVNNAHQVEAELFLRDIMPPALAAPLKPAVEQAFEPQPPRALIPKPLLSPKLLQQPWTWSGPAFTESSSSKPVFSVTLCDLTTAVNGGLRFNIALASMDSLYFYSFHDAADLITILPACQGVHQFARLRPRENADVEPLGIFSTYMAKMKKIVLLPIHLDNVTVAHIVFFHHNTSLMTTRFQPPFEIRRDGGLVAALVPWTLTSAQMLEHYRKPPNKYLPTQTGIQPLFKDEARWERTVRTRPRYHHSIRVLNFPRTLHNYLSEDGHERTFCAWFDGADVTKNKAGMETLALHTVLEKCRTRPSSIRDARIIFIHVGALKSLHKLPGLLEICSSSFSTQFYTYGTHESIAPNFWGIREIYPCGGLVTFTPQALIDDPIGVFHRLDQIHSHPMWECYILPSVLGMVAKVYGQREKSDPIVSFESGKFPYSRLLDAIEEGELSLLSSPPRCDLSATNDTNPRQIWLEKHWIDRPFGPRAILKTSLDSFDSKYGALSPANWTSAITAEISQDLRRMRCQPVFMEKYRRYVVLDRTRELPKNRHDALEWTSVTKFNFKDDFFPEQ